ncbi:MAG: tRNA uridine(34) 5-carboxymethylaminomethyl modification radical SAM/GNAT enzyme Elp3 [Candidatus Staskawiczbacteria bacterium CG10_big_fil_rev_8_21_14_0_10_38_10]|uniref:tRNA carboxymethyluridine synthase n=1 Tax=Candidatus Staskawiczbacteria bacterium CG10_big_fil_rev_8_21_14_0_10_38_10 TaxID=1974891 RepID=A0A2H9T144_9BACT|nr:MAG: tRNA uridine(34) 5-carboxymethylaminomethyl modification radical SAM/GNAT enzyme Elp3 [Candidatus Staskawiczbacteria bacterium CG10_big_fil_rev_8_21_14_0_10_38_10]
MKITKFYKNSAEEIIKNCVKIGVKSQDDLTKIKRKLAKEYKTPLSNNIELLKVYHKLVKSKRIKPAKRIEKLLQTRPIRSVSGIVNVSVLTSPRPKWGAGQALSCPGICIFCPIEKGLPKSYVSGEPAVERAKILKFDPYLQVKKRIEMLKNQGHLVDKVEIRVIGGSFTFYPETYKKWFLKRCFDGANPKTSKNLKEAQKINETAKQRIVGISIETRSDLINETEIRKLRELGVTLVELGVQSVFDDVLDYSKTGSTVQDIIKATELLKDAGFKVMYQIMPNLPKSSIKRDKKTFEEIFQNPDLKPDWLKIYPCMVLKETQLYKLWQEKKYKSYPDKQLISLIKYIKSICPYWIRIARIYRDIPKEKIVSGCKISNLREIINAEMKKEGTICKCIRCREVKEKFKTGEEICLFREDYEASGGKEMFLSFENKNRSKLYSFLRLRIPILKKTEDSPLLIFPVLENAAIIRELHTYGPLQPLGGPSSQLSPQHRGLGKRLIKEAEKIAEREFNLKKIAVISGVGARDYYRKLGYKLEDTYMVKSLN